MKRAYRSAVAVGFGVTTPKAPRAIARIADGVVVGSAIVEAMRRLARSTERAATDTVAAVTELVACASRAGVQVALVKIGARRGRAA